MALNALVADCPPLDTNSVYCNLLQCSHFSATSMGAFRDGRLLGSLTAYCPPDHPDTLFVWQVAVHPDARGQALGRQLLERVLAQTALHDVRFVETTITADNGASWHLFRRFAETRAAATSEQVMFDRTSHFQDRHDTEYLLRIGPLDAT